MGNENRWQIELLRRFGVYTFFREWEDPSWPSRISSDQLGQLGSSHSLKKVYTPKRRRSSICHLFSLPICVFKYTINAKAKGLWQIKTVIKTEAQPRFLWAVFICHKPEAEAFIVFRFNSEILRITILTFKLFFLYSCKRQMTTHLHTRYRQSDIEAAKTWVNAVHTYAWYKIFRRMHAKA